MPIIAHVVIPSPFCPQGLQELCDLPGTPGSAAGSLGPRRRRLGAAWPPKAELLGAVAVNSGWWEMDTILWLLQTLQKSVLCPPQVHKRLLEAGWDGAGGSLGPCATSSTVLLT